MPLYPGVRMRAQREIIEGVQVLRTFFGQIGEVGAHELARRVAKAAMDQALLVDAAAIVAVAPPEGVARPPSRRLNHAVLLPGDSFPCRL
jgi:hypothetical protein